jgi:hypothetical protein
MPDSKQIAPSPSRAALVAAERVFKTAHFADQSIKAGIHAAELCHKAKKLSAEQGENLGGNVWETRLNRNAHRAILLRKVGQWWIYAFLFAKKIEKT